MHDSSQGQDLNELSLNDQSFYKLSKEIDTLNKIVNSIQFNKHQNEFIDYLSKRVCFVLINYLFLYFTNFSII